MFRGAEWAGMAAMFAVVIAGCADSAVDSDVSTPNEGVTTVDSIQGADNSIVAAVSLCDALRVANAGLGVYTVTQIDLETRPDLHEGNRVAHIQLELDRSFVAGTPEQLQSEMIVSINLTDESEPPSGDTVLEAGEQVLLAVRLEDGDPATALVNHMTVAYSSPGGWTHPRWSYCAVDEDTLLERAPAMFEYLSTFDRDGDLEFDCPGDAFEINPSNPLVRDCSL
jgi:hypothetical protein